MEKQYILVLALVLLILFSLNFSEAHFVCGKVNSGSEFVPAWFDVRVYYSNLLNATTFCKVNAGDGKYCCDLEDIKSTSFGIGKTLKADIFNNGTALFSNSVSLITSSEGYDVFPDMTLLRAINLNPEPRNLYAGIKSLFFNVSLHSNFTGIRYILKRYGNILEENQICINCNSANFTIQNITGGEYNLKLESSNGANWINREVNFQVLDYLYFDRIIGCPKCKGDILPPNTEVTVKIRLNSSENISGVLKDYFPKDWKLKEESAESYSESHNFISWVVSGRETEKIYKLVTPKITLPKRYILFSEFEGFFSNNSVIRVSKTPWLPLFLPLEKPTKPYSYNKTFFIISPEFPLSESFNEGTVKSIAIYPLRELNRTFAYVTYSGWKNFEIISNVRDKDIAQILIRLRIKKDSYVTDVKIMENQKTKIANMTQYFEDEVYSYFEGYVSKKGKFSVII